MGTRLLEGPHIFKNFTSRNSLAFYNEEQRKISLCFHRRRKKITILKYMTEHSVLFKRSFLRRYCLINVGKGKYQTTAFSSHPAPPKEVKNKTRTEKRVKFTARAHNCTKRPRPNHRTVNCFLPSNNLQHY